MCVVGRKLTQRDLQNVLCDAASRQLLVLIVRFWQMPWKIGLGVRLHLSNGRIEPLVLETTLLLGLPKPDPEVRTRLNGPEILGLIGPKCSSA